MFFRLLFTAFILVLLPSFVYAQDSTTSKQLETLSKDLEDEKQKKAALKTEARDIEKTLKSARQNLVKITKSIQNNEATLDRLKADILRQEQEYEEMLGALTEDQKSISSLILGLNRMRQMPPEAMIIKPGAPYKTAQSAMLLEKMLPRIHAQAARLRDDLAELERKTKALQEDRRNALARAQILEDETLKLGSLLAERERLFSKTNANLKMAETNIKNIAKKSESLKQLLTNLEQEQTRQAGKNVKQVRNTPIPKAGKPSLPIQGKIIIGYKELDAFGAPSEGLTLQGKSGSIVTAPMGGVVRFAGQFKNYGKMVIIEHKGKYHSLIAGMEKMNVSLNQSVLSGEPIGTLSKDAQSSHHVYFELRYKGKAIHPKKRIAGL